MEPSFSLPLFSLLMLVALQPIQAAVYRVTVDGSGTLKFNPSAIVKFPCFCVSITY
jgi:hypothetical protein